MNVFSSPGVDRSSIIPASEEINSVDGSTLQNSDMNVSTGLESNIETVQEDLLNNNKSTLTANTVDPNQSIEEIAKKIKQEHQKGQKQKRDDQVSLTANVIIDLVTKSVHDVLEQKLNSATLPIAQSSNDQVPVIIFFIITKQIVYI